MKKALFLIAVFACIYSSHAQKKEIPAFGKIEKSELENHSCSYDPGAAAEVIFEDGESACKIIETATAFVISTEQKIHVRIKILNEKGVDRGNVKLTYYSSGNRNRVMNVTGQTYNLDGGGQVVISKMDKSSIYEKRLDKKMSEISFALPEVKVGSVIEYKYTIYSEGFHLPNWYFQQSIPVRQSRCLVEIPKGIEFISDPNCSLPYDQKFEEYSESYARIYTMRNIPGLPDEPFMTSDDDYLQRIGFRFSAYNSRYGRQSMLKSWPEVIKELMDDEDFGKQLMKNIAHTAELDELIRKESDPARKMCVIYNYVRKAMAWDGTRSKWALDGVKSAWEKKKGTSGEINLILVNLLKDAGLDASPVLVSTRSNGMVNAILAYIDQFNTVMAYCKIGDKFYVMDACDKFTPANMIPASVVNTQGLVINKVDDTKNYANQGWGWVALADDQQHFLQQVAIQSEIHPDGLLTGEAVLSHIGYARIKSLKEWASDPDQFKKEHFISPFQGVKIDEVAVDNKEKDSLPFTQKFKFSLPLQSSGDYQYFTVNLFSGLEKNPFLSEKRFTDIFFGYNQNYTIYGKISLPEGYSFEELPRNIRMIMPDTSITLTRFFEQDGNSLGMRITVEFRRPYYLVDEYPYFREFYKKLFDVLNEQVVVRKTKP